MAINKSVFKIFKNALTFLYISIEFTGFLKLLNGQENIPKVFGQSQVLKIKKILPEDTDVFLPSQITIEFDQPMVRLDDPASMEQEIGLSLYPMVEGKWQWLTEKTLVFHPSFPHSFSYKTLYNLTIKAGLKSQNGFVLDADYHHHFTTGTSFEGTGLLENNRPEIGWENPDYPYVKITFNQPVLREAVQKDLFFVVKNKPEKRYDVRVEPLPCDETPPFYPEKKEGNPKFESRKKWMVIPARSLPAGQDIILRSDVSLAPFLGFGKSQKTVDVYQFRTFSLFKFIGIKGQTLKGKEVFVTADASQKEELLLNPESPVGLVFTAPTTYKNLQKNVFLSSLTEPLKGELNRDENSLEAPLFQTKEELPSFNTKGEFEQTYTYWLLPPLKADQDHTIGIKLKVKTVWEKIKSFFYRTPETDLSDQFGRKLEKATAFTVRTDHQKPNFDLPYHRVVLEKNNKNHIPLYVNNITSAHFIYQSLTAQESQPHYNHKLTIPPVYDVRTVVPLEIRQLLGGKSGAVYGTLEVTPSLKKHWQQSSLFAQVTPYHVFVKFGHYNTLVWVTDFLSGKPVSYATVQIYPSSFSTLYNPVEALSKGTTNSLGIAILEGSSTLDPKNIYLNNWTDYDQTLFVSVKKGEEMALVPLSYDYKINIGRISNGEVEEHSKHKYNHIIAWGLSSQKVYHIGDTLNYKIYVRNPDNQALKPAPTGSYTLDIIDPLGKIIDHKENCLLNEFGALQGSYSLSKEAPVGLYSFQLTGVLKEETDAKIDNETGYIIEDKESLDDREVSEDAFSHDDKKTSDEQPSDLKKMTITRVPLQVLVTDFASSPLIVGVHIDREISKPGRPLTLKIEANHQNGKPYASNSSQLRAVLTPGSFCPETPLTQGFLFEAELQNSQEKVIVSKSISLDQAGEYFETIVVDDPLPYGFLHIEGSIPDEQGKYLKSVQTLPYYGVDRFVGLKKKEESCGQNSPLSFLYVVTDRQGNLIEDVKVEFKVDRNIPLGGETNDIKTLVSYVWETVNQTSRLSQTEAELFTFTSCQSGLYKLTATIRDTKGRVSTATLPFSVGEKIPLKPVDSQSEHYLQITPGEKKYKVGETAEFIVNNPYPGATALITVERLGVMDHWIQTFEGPSSIIQIPIKPDYLPGFYLSVTVISPRTKEAPLNFGEVDLGKPTVRMGYVAVPVKDYYKKINVHVSPDKKIYKAGETVTLSLTAVVKNQQSISEPIEFAVTVIDENIFDFMMKGIQSPNPYKGFYMLDTLDVGNYDLLTCGENSQLQNKKELSPSSEGKMLGGALFEPIAYWNPSIITQNGQATVSFVVPSKAVKWRVLATAVTPTDRFGLGKTSFSVNDHTQIYAIMPPQITEKDSFKAGFRIVNQLNKKRLLAIKIKATGPINFEKNDPFFTQHLAIDPFKEETMWLPVQIGSSQTSKKEEAVAFSIQAEDEQGETILNWEAPVVKAKDSSNSAPKKTKSKNKNHP